MIRSNIDVPYDVPSEKNKSLERLHELLEQTTVLLDKMDDASEVTEKEVQQASEYRTRLESTLSMIEAEKLSGVAVNSVLAIAKMSESHLIQATIGFHERRGMRFTLLRLYWRSVIKNINMALHYIDMALACLFDDDHDPHDPSGTRRRLWELRSQIRESRNYFIRMARRYDSDNINGFLLRKPGGGKSNLIRLFSFLRKKVSGHFENGPPDLTADILRYHRQIRISLAKEKAKAERIRRINSSIAGVRDKIQHCLDIAPPSAKEMKHIDHGKTTLISEDCSMISSGKYKNKLMRIFIRLFRVISLRYSITSKLEINEIWSKNLEHVDCPGHAELIGQMVDNLYVLYVETMERVEKKATKKKATKKKATKKKTAKKKTAVQALSRKQQRADLCLENYTVGHKLGENTPMLYTVTPEGSKKFKKYNVVSTGLTVAKKSADSGNFSGCRSEHLEVALI